MKSKSLFRGKVVIRGDLGPYDTYKYSTPGYLSTKFFEYIPIEEKPFNGQNKTLSMFLDDTACLFHSAIESGICSNFMEFGQNCNF